MLRLLVASVLALVLSGLATAGGAVCAGEPDPTSCCCAHADAPGSSPAMRMCCELVCHKKTGDTPSTPAATSASLPVPDLPVAAVRVESEDEVVGASLPVTLKSARAALTAQSPPAVYVRKATFLI